MTNQPERISLAPWEHNEYGYEKAESAFRVEVDGCFFVVQLRDDFLRFRELSARHRSQPSQWNFAIRERVTESDDRSENALRALFENAWKRGRYGRIVFLEDGNVIFLGRNGTGVVFERIGRGYGKEAGTTEFRFKKEGDFDSHPARYWRDEVEAWDADEESEFRFVLGLVSEDDNGIAHRVCSIGAGGWPEMEHMARLLLRADARWNDVDCASFELPGVQVQMQRGKVPEVALVTAYPDSWGPQNSLVAYWCTKVPFEPGASWEAWLRHFVRGFDEDNLRRATAGKWVRKCNFVITDEPTENSAHERLEELLFVRDWLRDKLHTSQIEEIFAHVQP